MEVQVSPNDDRSFTVIRTAKLQFYNVLTKAESRISEQNRSLGVVTTFLSDNPAILTLADDRYFKSLFKRYQFPALTNLGTHVSMMNSLNCNDLISKAILSHTVGGLCAGVAAHWIYVLLTMLL